MSHPDDNRPQPRGTAAGTIMAGVFRLLRGMLRRGSQHSGREVVTEATTGPGTGSYDWIRDVAERPNNASLRFYRFAEGGDLAYNGLQRLPDITLCHPDYVIVLLGDNDVLALISSKVAQFDRLTNHLPSQPSPEWFRENMQAIVRRLKRDTSARIALCSLIPIGEDPSASHSFQAEANRRIAEYSAIIEMLAREEALSYLPFYERMQQLIVESPGRAFTSFDFLPFYL